MKLQHKGQKQESFMEKTNLFFIRIQRKTRTSKEMKVKIG